MPTPYPTQLFSGPDYLALPRHSQPWLIQGLIPRSGILLVYAPSKQGKSTAILQLTSTLSTPGTDFFGLPCFEHGPVGFLQLDTPAELWRDTYIDRMASEGKLNFSNVFFHDRNTIPQELHPFNILNPLHAEWLTEWCVAGKFNAVVIDTFRACWKGQEKDDGMVQDAIVTLQKAIWPAALILLHHNRKAAADSNQHTDEGIVDSARGSSNLPAMADVLWRLSRKKWTIVGRGGDISLKITFDKSTGLLSPSENTESTITLVLKDPTLASERAQAAKLSELTGLSYEAARTRLRRHRRAI